MRANGFKTHGLDRPDNRVRSNWDLATECVEECTAACPNAALHVFGQEMTVDQVLDEVEQGMPHVDAVLDDHQVTDSELDKKWVGADNRRVLANFQQAYETLPRQTLIARTPFIPEMNDDGIRAIVAFTRPYQKVVNHELLPYCGPGALKLTSRAGSETGKGWSNISSNREKIAAFAAPPPPRWVGRWAVLGTCAPERKRWATTRNRRLPGRPL